MSLLDTASLIVTPNGYKEGKLYSVIPSDGSGDLSVTRATTATRVNSAGLVELVPYNLAKYSEQFDNAIWLKDAVTISANATTAPDATLTADLIYPQSSGDFKYTYQAYTQGNNVYTSSVYVKAQNKSKIWMYIESVGGYGICYFDLTNGTIQATTLIGSIENVGNGWYRCSVTTASSLSLISGTGFGVCDALGSPYVTANGTDGVYIWGAQLVEGSSAKDYQKTETRLNIPRLDYSNGTCPSILVEPQRTNVLTWSSSFDDAAWAKSGITITANNIVSPSGVQDADLSTANNGAELLQLQILSTSTQYTFSFYVKKGTASDAKYRVYNFDAGVNVVAPTSYISQTSTSDWARVSVTFTSTSSGTNYGIYLLDSASAGTMYFWGAQLEAGSYATSYIPTTSASVTRNADVISKTGISSLIGQTEGTLFAEIYADQAGSSNNWFEIYDGTSNNWIFVGKDGIKMRGYIRTSGTTHFDNTIFTITDNAPMKVALAYKSGDYAFYINGTLIASGSSSFTINNSISIVNFGFGLSTVGDSSAYKATALWKTRLTNTQLAQLTTI